MNEAPIRTDPTELQTDRLAQALVRRGLGLPALLALELFRPLSTLGYNVFLALNPLAAALIGNNANVRIMSFLEDRQNVERLIRDLEAAQASRHAGN